MTVGKLAPAFKDGDDTVSRTWRKVKSDWDAWNTSSLAEEPLRPIYAYTGAESDALQKFVLDLRGKSATPEAIQASQNNLTDVGAVAP